jgi:hypothetical protein
MRIGCLNDTWTAPAEATSAGAANGPHVHTTNGAVARLLSIFAPDAELIFEGHIVAALWGTAEIGRYFRDHPPVAADVMTTTGSTFDGEHTATAEFRRAEAPSRRAGTVALVENEGYIARITITVKARK